MSRILEGIPFQYSLITNRINSTEYIVQVKDEYDALLHRLGLDKMLTTELRDVKAPMPGLVLKLLVIAGDTVVKGDSLIILEAMKMENILKASSDGVGKNIPVKEGDKVEKNQLLISF
jgi:biotin carboxyl carrier protein